MKHLIKTTSYIHLALFSFVITGFISGVQPLSFIGIYGGLTNVFVILLLFVLSVFALIKNKHFLDESVIAATVILCLIALIMFSFLIGDSKKDLLLLIPVILLLDLVTIIISLVCKVSYTERSKSKLGLLLLWCMLFTAVMVKFFVSLNSSLSMINSYAFIFSGAGLIYSFLVNKLSDMK